MRIAHQLLAHCRALFTNKRVDADLTEEMRFHLDRDTEANIARGLTPEAARREARLAFGSMVVMQEQSRAERPGSAIRQLFRDLRFGFRLFRKSPGFSVAGITIIALGIGAATAIFSVVYGVMLRPLPYQEPERLVSVWLLRGPNRARTMPGAADAIDLAALKSVFTDVAFYDDANLNLVGDAEPRRLQGARVSTNLFSVLGAQPALGRGFAPGEGLAGNERVVVLSDMLWRDRFGGDRAILGKSLRINGAPHTVVGVMASDFHYPTSAHEAWVPIVVPPKELTREEIDNYRVIGRLAPGRSLDVARREISVLAARIEQQFGPGNGPGMTADAMLADAVRDVRPALRLLLGAVAFLLLLACVNLSNLFGARASGRRSEFALRLALGASRRRLIVQSIAESVPVLALGGALGILAAFWAVRLFAATAPAGLPRVENVSVSAPVVAFSLALLVLTALAVSIAPAVQAWSSDFSTIVKGAGARSATAGQGRTSWRRLAVGMQIAFALPLLVGAGLLIRSAIKLTQVDVGFSAEHVATLSFEVSRSKHASNREVADYYSRVVEAVKAVPGVSSAALVNRIPLGGGQSNQVRFESATGPADQLTDVDSRTITPEYFATLGIPIRAGRAFSEHDDSAAPLVGIVDERIANSMWPGESALGKRFQSPDERWGTVVGVVGHVRATGLEVDPRSQVYWSYRQWTQDRMVLAVRSTIDANAMFTPVAAAIRSVDPDQSVYNVRSLAAIVAQSSAQRRLTTILVVGFGAAALLLAAVGVYGVVAYGVTQRLREFGIRVALGATARQVTGLVVWQGASIAVAGCAIGLVLAVAAARLMASQVFGVTAHDAASIVGATALLLVVTAVASYIPARRAARVDPGIALRAE